MRPFSAWAKVMGHRGSAGTAPENTLLSFREARDAGAQAVEFDVVLAKDGVPVVFHDATLERTTNGHGNVWDHAVEELKQLDAGSWFLPQCAGERIPTLEETLKLCAALGLRINVEIKPQPGLEIRTTEAVVEMLERWWPLDQSLPLLSSFAVASVSRALELKPDWPRGLIFDLLPPDWRERMETVQATTLHGNAKYPSLLLELVATAKPVYAYTVNDVKRARGLFALGIAGIFTDYPGQMLPFAPGQRAAEPVEDRAPLREFRPKALADATSGNFNWSPVEGHDLVEHAEHAVRLGQSMLSFYLGVEATDTHAPYHADLHSGVWTVTGRTNGLSTHRTPEISFSKRDGQIYRILADR
jgi:glycerophosphoryl diester phosphodiesterase